MLVRRFCRWLCQCCLFLDSFLCFLWNVSRLSTFLPLRLQDTQRFGLFLPFLLLAHACRGAPAWSQTPIIPRSAEGNHLPSWAPTHLRGRKCNFMSVSLILQQRNIHRSFNGVLEYTAGWFEPRGPAHVVKTAACWFGEMCKFSRGQREQPLFFFFWLLEKEAVAEPSR